MSRGGARFDAIIIGGGHNGLVCAAYLARAGLSTLVLERRETLGGMAETVERWPGVGVPTLAHTVGRLRPTVARDLQLREHGLRLVEPDVRVFAPQPDGGGTVLYGDVARTTAALRDNPLVGAPDADRYAEIDGEFRALARALAALHDGAPPDLASPSLGDVVGGVRSLVNVRARTPAQAASGGLMRVMPMAVRDLVDEWFESDALRAAIAARGVLLTGLGPRMPGTGGVLFTDAAGTDSGIAGRTVFARGGPGAIGDALRIAARLAHIATGATVERVLTRDGAVVGVRLADGDEFEADVVVSTLDPRTTLLKLIEPEVLGPRLGWRASNIRQRGVTAKVNFALRGLPRFVGADDPSVLRGRILIAPSMAFLDAAMTPAKYGRQADEPLIEATIPTLVDPALIDTERSGDVRHVFSAVVQTAVDESIADVATRMLDRYAPGFADLVVDREVITPADIERDWGADGGHPMHAEVSLDQWFAWRPLHGLGRYRMPVSGMYLAGSGAHPGGGVTGGPGQLAAREVLRDWSHLARPREPEFPGLRRCLAMMRDRDLETSEDGFHFLLPHVAEFVPELLAEFRAETDPGMRGWLLELIGEARSDLAFDTFVAHLKDPELRFWAITGLENLGSERAMQALWEAREDVRAEDEIMDAIARSAWERDQAEDRTRRTGAADSADAP